MIPKPRMPILIAVASLSLSGAAAMAQSFHRREGQLEQEDLDANAKIPVLIVGGGPVGLALAGELGWRGVACMLVEQGDGTIVTPKMNEVNVRTMEFCRRWGIADQVHNCPFPRDHAARRGVRHEPHRP